MSCRCGLYNSTPTMAATDELVVVSRAFEFCEEESQYIGGRLQALLGAADEQQTEALLNLRLEVKMAFSALVSVLDAALAEAVSRGTDPEIFRSATIQRPIEMRTRQRQAAGRGSPPIGAPSAAPTTAEM